MRLNVVHGGSFREEEVSNRWRTFVRPQLTGLSNSCRRPVFTSGDAYLLKTGYDTQGRKTNGFTTRDNGATWDETQWEFDLASGVNTAKVYADDSRISYNYTDNGQRTRTTWRAARGSRTPTTSATS